MFTMTQKLGRLARGLGLLGLVAVLGGLLLSATPVGAAPKGGGVLSVYVGDGTTYANVANATVVVQSTANDVTIKGLTDAGGYFKTTLAAGSYIVRVLTNEYVEQKAEVGVKVGVTSKLAFMLQRTTGGVTPPAQPAFMVPTRTLYVHAVSGATGNNVANAAISVRDTAGQEVLKGATDSAGEFKTELPVGNYVVVAEAAGYQPYKVAVTVDNSSEVTRVDVKLESALTTSWPPPGN